jgi:hypothetical protein
MKIFDMDYRFMRLFIVWSWSVFLLLFWYLLSLFNIIFLIVCIVTSALHSTTNFWHSYQYSGKAGAEQSRNYSLIPGRDRFVLFSEASRTALGPTWPPHQWMLFPWVKYLGILCKGENEWSCTSTSHICLHGMHLVNFLYGIMCVGMFCDI